MSPTVVALLMVPPLVSVEVPRPPVASGEARDRRQLSVGWYRYAMHGRNLVTGYDLPLACRKHRSHIPFLRTA
jgi:hypothetical protein